MPSKSKALDQPSNACHIVVINLGIPVKSFSVTDRHSLLETPWGSTTATTEFTESTYVLSKPLPPSLMLYQMSFEFDVHRWRMRLSNENFYSKRQTYGLVGLLIFLA